MPDRADRIFDTEALLRARKRKALTQEGLAYRSGVSPKTIVNIESGRVEPRSSTVVLLARTLDIEVADLYR